MRRNVDALVLVVCAVFAAIGDAAPCSNAPRDMYSTHNLRITQSLAFGGVRDCTGGKQSV